MDLADYSDGNEGLDVDILIGSDQYWELVTGETRRGNSGLVAICTKLGWVLSGPTASTTTDVPASCLVTHSLRVDGLSSKLQQLDNRIKSFWELESFGISASENSVYDDFESLIQQVDGRYEVQLPWKEGHPTLTDNYQLSLRRLHGLMKRLKQDPAILQEYDTTIRSQIQQGIVEKVEPSEEEPKNVHYLPHHAVVRQDKQTTKVRVVYDASARTTGPSLNDCLHVGPKLHTKIFDILLRFRVHRIAIIGDIEKAFLMISVAKQDRDALRFLWYKDVQADQLELLEYRFARVIFGVSSSPFLLNATIRHHPEKYKVEYPDLIEKVIRSLYVDDLASGADNEEQAFQMFSLSREILKEAGFNLRKFYSNSEALQSRVNPDVESTLPPKSAAVEELEETYSSSTLGGTQKLRRGEQKVLGVRWDLASDQLVINLEDITSAALILSPTKRNIVSLVGRFYDPLGYLTPVVIQFKLFLRELCEAKIDWDQLLSGELKDLWNSLKSSLQYSPSISIPRCYLEGISEEIISCRLCGFCDASTKAYAGVVYLLIQTSAGYSTKFVSAKSRVAPLQQQTIPRLELLSALLLARLLSTIAESLAFELTLSSPFCFTDSMVALCWIKGTEKIWKTFVQNRVAEIRKLVSPGCWRHCPGIENPADVPSRGATPLELSTKVLWHKGPPWLIQGELSSSTDDDETTEPSEACLAELKKDQEKVHGLLITGTEFRLSEIIDYKKFGSFERLIKTTSLVLKFCRILLNRVHGTDNSEDSFDTIAEAEHQWILECQRMVTSDQKFEQWRSQFDLFEDDKGVWRCRGRIQNALVSYSTKYPVILHKDHYFALLVTRKAHEQVLHNGVKETLTELRNKFWIIRGRNLAKKVVKRCRICRRYEGRPYSAPPPPPLPTFRVEEAPPFSFTGCDFAGPLYVKGECGQKKVWICLFTCCVTRAVHLELVVDMSTPTFLRCFRRFVGRRGLPKQIVSDNGKTFKAATKALQDVKWIFNVPKAPWWGGVFERLVRSVKKCLKKILGLARLTYDELFTALVEVEGVLNSRPLTVLSADDLEEPLTPSHLIVGHRLRDTPDPQCPSLEDVEVNADVATKRAQYLARTIAHYWKRWKWEYLVGLREIHSQRKRKSHAPRISVGDVVIIHDDQPRAMWKLGRVEEVLVGADGETRAAVLRVSGQRKSSKYLRRPVQRLYPLEMTVVTTEQLQSQSEEAEPDPETEPEHDLNTTHNDTPESSTPVQQRPRRVAAQIARDRLLAQTIESEEEDDS